MLDSAWDTYLEKHEIFWILCYTVTRRCAFTNTALDGEPAPSRKFVGVHTKKYAKLNVQGGMKTSLL